MKYFRSTMDSDNVNCTPKPAFKELTQFFLDNFGTSDIPAGYVKGDTYGPRTNKQDFAELFIVFDILIVLAILCVFVLLMMILFLVWYYKRCNCESETCRRIKLWTILITSLLLLSLILSAFGLYIVFKNIAHLKQVYTKPEDSQGNKFDEIGTVVSEILGDDFENLMDNSIYSCWNSDLLKDLYPATTKLQKMSKVFERMYKPYIENFLMPAFPNTLLYDDVYRMFARNFSAYMTSGKQGIPIILETKALQYGRNLFSLEDWGKLYNSSNMISELLPYYARTAQSNMRMSRVCAHIEDYFDEISASVNQQKNFINEKVKTLFQKKMTERNAPYKFGYIICIIAIAVLAIYLMLLLCSLCLKFKAMIKPLIFIFIILTLVFILMAFVTFFHFFYGVIGYNGLCKENTRTKADSFIYMMHKQCTDNQKVYTLLTDNHWIKGLSQWSTIDEAEILEDCMDTCTILDRKFIDIVFGASKDYPNKNFCEYKAFNQSWLDLIISKHGEYQQNMSDFDKNYFAKLRKNKTLCLLDLAKHGREVSKRLPRKEYLRCSSGYKAGKHFTESLKPAYDELNSLCKTTVDSCNKYVKEISLLVQNVNAFKTNSEEKLKQELGPCEDMLSSATIKQKEFCNCESYMLNGVWVGSILFLLGTLLTLLLLPCLLCLFVKCSEDDCICTYYKERRDEESEELAHSIVLPAITLPKHVINSLQEDPRVNYKVKKIN
ncbi:PREDICTED: uncharacterized protein LOC108969969 isoform X1 [Bactrocera latifrons]|uniref:uncharacterized protein LOC108969969 isoform X1 n=1 Tax=Bactrocera latifrons TaxID=174628 RepID=UPI0008DD9D80|nr:PREDICTED: uncharacterized protein LOC108969969 isoform X1 [Bactrocera latifrons]XP_018790571.1 PREDICTED: uncharacterized protein LOC108969969 isoform X1 [Bactrocera latifrons]